MYNSRMPVTGKSEVIKEEGQDKDAFTVSFTNGAKEQLEELRKYFDTPTDLDLIKLGISILQSAKERKERQEKEKTNASK